MANGRTIAYFSMEIGVEPGMPTYSGGLGVLAGDTLRSAADLKVPLVGVTLLSRKGNFRQVLDPAGRQTEEPDEWPVEKFLERQDARAAVTLEGRTVYLAAWRRDVTGVGGHKVPVYFLDTLLPENAEEDRTLTDYLYGGDARYRLCQEAVLGLGGVRMLRALGHTDVVRYHLNEGHAAFLTMELLDGLARRSGGAAPTDEDVQAVRQMCVFTTHTPVPAGHDRFPMDLVTRVLGQRDVLEMKHLFDFEGELNMTLLALNLSHFVNGVAKKHGEVSRMMYGPFTIDSITNGVHAATWTSKPFQDLFDRHVPGWREDNFSLRYALGIPEQEVWSAHMEVKRALVDRVNRETGAGLDPEVLTFGFARRAAAYKRADLLFQDLERLKDLAGRVGRFQVVYAGKAHPRDQAGKDVIQRVFQARDALRDHVRVAYLANYNMDLGRLMTAGVDVWLNTPQPPMEASGTSGMKAALNGVPSLSVLDGWWIEGCIEGVTGWAIGDRARRADAGDDRAADAASLYRNLEQAVLPTFYKDRDNFLCMMRHSIALNGSFFNTQRMIQQYVLKAYFL